MSKPKPWRLGVGEFSNAVHVVEILMRRVCLSATSTYFSVAARVRWEMYSDGHRAPDGHQHLRARREVHAK